MKIKCKRLKNHIIIQKNSNKYGICFSDKTYLIKKNCFNDFKKFNRIFVNYPFITKKNINNNKSNFLKKIKSEFYKFELNKIEKINLDIFSQKIFKCYLIWREILGEHEIYEKMKNDAILQKKYLLEITWFTYCSNIYLNSDERFIRNIYIQEKNHYKNLCKGIGVDHNLLINYEPSPSGFALISFLENLKLKNKNIQLLVCANFFETEKHEIKNVKKFYSIFRKTSKLKNESFIFHHKEDIDLNHSNNWLKFLKNNKKLINVLNLNECIHNLHMVKHLYSNWLDEIIQESNYLKKSGVNKRLKINSFIKFKPNMDSI